MGKLIIRYEDGIEVGTALEVVGKVVDKGKISQGFHGDQYCFATTFESGKVVIADKTASGTDTFNVYQEKIQAKLDKGQIKDKIKEQDLVNYLGQLQTFGTPVPIIRPLAEKAICEFLEELGYKDLADRYSELNKKLTKYQ